MCCASGRSSGPKAVSKRCLDDILHETGHQRAPLPAHPCPTQKGDDGEVCCNGVCVCICLCVAANLGGHGVLGAGFCVRVRVRVRIILWATASWALAGVGVLACLCVCVHHSLRVCRGKRLLGFRGSRALTAWALALLCLGVGVWVFLFVCVDATLRGRS